MPSPEKFTPTFDAVAAMGPLLHGLELHGVLVVAGVGGTEPMTVNAVQIVFGERNVTGTLTGSPIEDEDTLAFSALQNVRAMIETVPVADAAEGYGRMFRNEARFRMVLVV